MADKKAEQKSEAPKDHKPFLCGVAVQVYQNSGDPNSNWGWFEKQKSTHVNLSLRISDGDLSPPDPLSVNEGNIVQADWPKLGPSTMKEGFQIGKSSDFWNRYKQDIQLCKDIGCNSFRLSLEWSRLYPRRGVLDQSAVERYNEIFDELDRQGMEPNVTLHWFTHPRWFDEIGGFLKEENVDVFVDWACTAFQLFGKRAKLWATFNEPAVASMCGYVAGNHPPGLILHFRECGIHLGNMMRCHAAAYEAIKALPGGKDVQVGIVHNVFWVEPRGSGPLYAHVRAAIAVSNRVWANETVMNFLLTGEFKYWRPLWKDIHWKHPKGKPGCDFFGLNHYARGIVSWTLQPSNKGPKGIADMGYPVYPPSLYRSITYASQLGVPVYVMENGMPSEEDDERREEWINGCLGEVERAVDDGYDVRGYMYWTLLDNFEWNFGWLLKFGLYEWHPDNDQKRRLRDGAKCIKKWYAELPDRLGKKLATLKPKNDKPKEQRLADADRAERDFLKQQGQSRAEIKEMMPDVRDPLKVGLDTM
ncbi:hypothetical protein WJX72_003165 [[Myrmecia] bisecta]|uniref:Beta-glucosidase n=1 Tax=[Myrmecia] bisecta TaxID=41462 RepID=A0AAW1PXI3_9CHLO